MSGRGRLVIIGGEAGIGKTTLALDVLYEGRMKGAMVLTGHCHDLSTTPPYAPWLDMAARYTPRSNDPELPPAFAQGYLTPFDSQTALFAGMLEFITTLASTQPVMILLEDMHWSDSASLELLRYLSTHLDTLPVLIVLTYRMDELTRQHPLYRQLPSLVRASNGLRLELKRLDARAMAHLVRSRHQLDADEELRLVIYLEQHAQGNPFFAIELIRALEEAQVLTQTGYTSHLEQFDYIVLPPLLTQVIDGRVSRLGDVAREALSFAAIVGEEVPLALWADVARLDEDQLLSIIEQAVDAHLLIASRDGRRVRFSHALIRDALYESLLPAHRRQRHKLVAEHLIADTIHDPDAIAHHLGQADDSRRADWLIAAGNQAQRAYAWLIAADRFIGAANALPATENTEHERGWLLFRAARLMRLADPERGLELLRQSRKIAKESGDLLLAADARYSYGLLMLYANRIDLGIAEFEAGIRDAEAMPAEIIKGDAMVANALADSLPKEEVAADKDLESSVTLQRSTGINYRQGGLPWWYSVSGRPQDAIEIGESFLTAVATLDVPSGPVISGTGHALFGMGIAQAQLGRPSDAQHAFERARTIYRECDHHGLTVLVYLAELRYLTFIYNVDDLANRSELTREAVGAIDQASGALPPGFPAAVNALPELVLTGMWVEAMTTIAETSQPGNTFFRQILAESSATIAFHRGQYDEAWAVVQAALPAGPEQLPGSRLFQEALFFQRLAAELAIQAGDFPGARRWLEAHERWLEQSRATLGRADGKHMSGLLALATGDIEAASIHATESLTLASQPRQPLVMLAAHLLLADIQLAKSGGPSVEGHLNTALSLADACQAPFERARVLSSMARHELSRNNLSLAATRAREALAIGKRLGAEPLLLSLASIPLDVPASSSDSNPDKLTAREREVLSLVAQGMTDADVASRLFISPRTVSQHLRSIYGKIDVSSRSAATRYAIEHHLG